MELNYLLNYTENDLRELFELYFRVREKANILLSIDKKMDRQFYKIHTFKIK